MDIRYWIGVILPFFLSSCSDEKRWDCVKSAGEEITEERMVSGFDELFVEDKIDVSITQDTIFKVEVIAGENLMEKIVTEVSGKTLTIRNGNKCNFMRSYKKTIRVQVHLPVLKKLTHEGVGEISSTNTIVQDTLDLLSLSAGNMDLLISCNKVLTHIAGTGDISLSGSTYEHACHAMSHGFFNGDQLQTSYTWLSWNGTGNAKVRSSGLLIALINLSGDVYYTGNPSVISEITGTGKLLVY